MMSKSKTRKTYPPSFKEDVVIQSEDCDSIQELADDLGLDPQLIYSWRSRYKKDPDRSFRGRGNPARPPQEEKITKLEHQLAQTRTERDILKKAMGIFTSRQG
jgi:transposase